MPAAVYQCLSMPTNTHRRLPYSPWASSPGGLFPHHPAARLNSNPYRSLVAFESSTPATSLPKCVCLRLLCDHISVIPVSWGDTSKYADYSEIAWDPLYGVSTDIFQHCERKRSPDLLSIQNHHYQSATGIIQPIHGVTFRSNGSANFKMLNMLKTLNC